MALSASFPVRRWILRLLASVFAACSLHAAPTMNVPAGIDHAAWTTLLERYVDERGFVDYAGWHASEEDVASLDRYLAQFARDAADRADRAAGDAEIAALINAYNAFTIRWILENFPTESIRKTEDQWSAKRWAVGGEKVSLDEIEHENLRPLHGWRVHATIVCAARSCPPLQRRAFTAENLAALTAEAFTAWLRREDLNRYLPERNRVEVSKIFDWFEEDFTGEGSLRNLLLRFGPPEHEAFFREGDFRVRYRDYDWGLNDQGSLGENYSPGLFGIL